jgi:hypothetical protein
MRSLNQEELGVVLDRLARGWSALGEGDVWSAEAFLESAWNLTSLYDLSHEQCLSLQQAIQTQKKED